MAHGACYRASQEGAVKSHEVIKEMFDRQGAKHVAAELGVSLSLLYKWSEPEGESGAANPLDRVAELARVTNDDRAVQWLARLRGGIFVKNPERALGKVDVFRETQRILKEFADVLQAVSSAWDDSRLTADEIDRIRHEWDELKSIGETFVMACEDHASKKR